jgi:hypothetical protein
MTAYIVFCEVMKIGFQQGQRYELKVALLMNSDDSVDEILNAELKLLDYLFMYSGEVKTIQNYLENNSVYDQDAIDLCDQLSSEKKLVCTEVRLINKSSKQLNAKDLLKIETIKVPELADQSNVGFWERAWIVPELKALLFNFWPANSREEKNRTYLVLDAREYTKINGFFDLDLIDYLPIKCLFKDLASIELKTTAPYLVDITLLIKKGNEFSNVTRFHKKYFTEHLSSGNGIFIQTSAGFEEVYDKLRKINRIENESGKWFYLRYYHANYLQAVLQSLNLGQLKTVFSEVDRFVCLDELDSFKYKVFSCETKSIVEKKQPVMYTKELQEGLKYATYFAQSKLLHKDLDIPVIEFKSFTNITTKLLSKHIDHPQHILKLYPLIDQAIEQQRQEIWAFLDEVDYSPGYKIMVIEKELMKQVNA